MELDDLFVALLLQAEADLTFDLAAALGIQRDVRLYDIVRLESLGAVAVFKVDPQFLRNGVENGTANIHGAVSPLATRDCCHESVRIASVLCKNRV
ncbi:MAG TPA: hypothetical protein VHO04_13220 [Sphingopyxis sp.]|uniref:Uncharacterized protein n=1 Tax=Sphingopyxis panaciterrulae TaxID=462372 RepID=A0A7W9ES97_9SPHN|nr:hypothetical protein [Sphingopyxis sp.]MBB5708464.1 hypothetical protein [Sphingopyxis panaciterrulae]HEX2813631.1 hypothetical protein [Sphingopyxis sp.]